jgi:phosphatidylserine decarboxylase
LHISSFCKKFKIPVSEFEKSLDQFTSFNDFFIRALKPEVRPHDPDPHAALVFADARYTFFENIQLGTSFQLKGIHFDLMSFLHSVSLAERFSGGTMVLARLCPIDCHRFYFPLHGEAHLACPIEGPLFSVNPVATKDRPWIFWTNRRMVTTIQREPGHMYAMVEVGATNVGTIVQTYVPGHVQRGAEKGYFKLGGSAVAVLFEKDSFKLSDDLKELSMSGLEVYCKKGQRLGTIQD